MTRQLNILRWGNGHGLRLPLSLLAAIDAKVGDVCEVEATPGSLVLRIVRRDGEPEPTPGAEDASSLDAQTVQRGLQNVLNETEHLLLLLEGMGRAPSRVEFQAREAPSPVPDLNKRAEKSSRLAQVTG
jgi:antitoxin component of MazEF toxin-antitoxin module